MHRSDFVPLVLPNALQHGLTTPALVVWRDVVTRNIDTLFHAVSGDAARLRPHLKTTKMPLIWRMLLDAGVRHFKCATTREAAVFAQTASSIGCNNEVDLLVAYPAQGPMRERLAVLAHNAPHVRFSALVEDSHALDDWPASLGVFLDLNPGMNRTGVSLDETDDIVDLADRCGERLRGLHFYDGHIRDGTVDDRRTRAHAGYALLLSLVERLAAKRMTCRELITSGTPTYLHALSYDGFGEGAFVHRVSPGTFAFYDAGYHAMLPELSFTPAARVVSRVISHPSSGVVTCDAGSKSLAAEVGDPCAVCAGHPSIAALRPSEEHLPLAVRESGIPARGTMLQLVPRHVCPTVNLYEQAIVVDGEHWSIEPISARGHELGVVR